MCELVHTIVSHWKDIEQSRNRVRHHTHACTLILLLVWQQLRTFLHDTAHMYYWSLFMYWAPITSNQYRLCCLQEHMFQQMHHWFKVISSHLWHLILALWASEGFFTHHLTQRIYCQDIVVLANALWQPYILFWEVLKYWYPVGQSNIVINML